MYFLVQFYVYAFSTFDHEETSWKVKCFSKFGFWSWWSTSWHYQDESSSKETNELFIDEILKHNVPCQDESSSKETNELFIDEILKHNVPFNMHSSLEMWMTLFYDQ